MAEFCGKWLWLQRKNTVLSMDLMMKMMLLAHSRGFELIAPL
jgi:hypothetical protein